MFKRQGPFVVLAALWVAGGVAPAAEEVRRAGDALSGQSDRTGTIHSARGGTISVDFDPKTLSSLGWSLSVSGKGASGDVAAPILLFIQSSSTLKTETVAGRLQRVPEGTIRTRGAFLLSTMNARVAIGDPVLARREAGVWTVTSTLGDEFENAASFLLSSVEFDENEDDRGLRLFAELSISDSLALQLGVPDATGTVVGTMTMNAEMAPHGDAITDSGSPVLEDAFDTTGGPAGTIGPDVIVADLQSVTRFGRVGDVTAYGVGTNACNIGDERVSWVSHNNQHPVILQSLFRLRQGRFEQIGMSWMKHGFYAISGSLCGPCTDHTSGAELGVGCSDPYSAGLNGAQTNMSRRSDLNAHTGEFPYPWTAPGYESAIGRRLQVHDADLDPAFNEGASYFVEGHYLTADDAAAGNADNNASHRPVILSVPREHVYDLAPTDQTQREQPAIMAWRNADPTVIESRVSVPDDGLFILAAKATDLDHGVWQYEYAIHNLNADRSAGSFAVPVGPNVTVENIGFHDVDYHSGESYDLSDWTADVDDGLVLWSTTDFGVNPNANALRWGTLYNFRFDADAAPGDVDVRIGLFKPGTPQNVTAPSVGPAGPPPACGDERVEGAEDCDPPDDLHCDPMCRWICGDGVVQGGEECDPPDEGSCGEDCRIVYVCGDGVVDPDEECDPPDGVGCDANCLRIPLCGDGIVDPDEECDPPDGDLCEEDCRLRSNDVCPSAFTICPGTHAGSTRQADTDGSATCGDSADSPDVWYVYRPATSGSATLDTCASGYDTVLSVHAGCPGVSANQIDCDDDACGLQSRVSLDVEGGVTYVIRVTGYSGRTGDYVLALAGPDCGCGVDSDCPDLGNACIDNRCIGGACVQSDNESLCEDGDPCTSPDTCSQGSCVSGPPAPCAGFDCTDCNENGVRDDCEGLPDCDGNGVPDECEFADCNGNDIADVCDIADGEPDCAGGPVGSVVDGADLFGSKCFSCHAADGSGGWGPDIRDASRVTLWRKLLPPTDHTAGAHPEYAQQDFADLEAFLATTGSRGRPDRIPDECQSAYDCDGDSDSDACELESGSQLDLDHDGLPDDCRMDCNGNGVDDTEDIRDGHSRDCNSNGTPDECDLAGEASRDVNRNGQPDECEDPFKVSLSVDGPPTVVAGVANDYHAVAHFSGGSEFEVTLFVDWTVTPDTEAEIDEFGRLVANPAPCSDTLIVDAAFVFGGIACRASREVALIPDDRVTCDDGNPCTIDLCDQARCTHVPDFADDDGDTVRNCDDQCPGFDDRLDCDADAAPDGCEPDSDGDGIPDDCDRKGDFDHDGDADLDDHLFASQCLALSGPSKRPPFALCVEIFDLDDDGDVDLMDVGRTQPVFTGSLR